MASRAVAALLAVLLFAAAAEAVVYRAASVQISPVFGGPAQHTREEAVAIMNTNIDKYEHFLKIAAANGTQLIVFPEDGLYGDQFDTRESLAPFTETIPDPRVQTVNPCVDGGFDDRPILKRFSCLARTYSVVLVADMADLQPCGASDPACPSDGKYQFNTQVAFSPEGVLLARYHKSHLFYEAPTFDQPLSPDPTYFDALGVRFGMIICFDMMFGNPTETYVRSLGIRNILQSTWFENIPPLFSAAQVQQAYSRTWGVNIIAANSGKTFRLSGSGIYSSGEWVAYHYNPTKGGDDALIVADVDSEASLLPNPRPLLVVGDGTSRDAPLQRPSRDLGGGWHPAWLPYLKMTTFEASPGAKGSAVAETDGVRCEVDYEISAQGTGERYGVAALTGNILSVGQASMCGILRCGINTLCLLDIFDHTAKTVFSSFEIRGNFTSAQTVLALAATDGAQLFPHHALAADGSALRTTGASNAPLLSALLLAKDMDE
eukprot:Opistho-1_new@97930